MRHNLEEDVALAALIGDGREDTDKDKIHENHIRSVWNDDELYTIHYDVDISAMEKKLQGTNTNANFGEEYIYAGKKSCCLLPMPPLPLVVTFLGV